jgi:hypothetical protein
MSRAVCQNHITLGLASLSIVLGTVVADERLGVDLRQPAGPLGDVGADAASSGLMTVAEWRGAWRWRSSHHDIAGSLEAVDDALGHDRGQQFSRLHPGPTAVTRQRESESCDEVVTPGRD